MSLDFELIFTTYCMLSLYLLYLINSQYKHIGKIQPWGNWGLVRLRSLPNWALLITGKSQNPIYFSWTLKFMLFSTGSLPGKVHSYQGPQTPGGKKKNNNSICSMMPKKFPQVVLSGDVSPNLPLHFHVNCTHKALHFRCVTTFLDTTDG